MAYDEDSGCSGGRNSAEIVSKGEHRPAVGDSAESRIRSIREPAVVNELSANDGILAGLPGRTLSLRLEEGSAYTSPARCGGRTLSVAWYAEPSEAMSVFKKVIERRVGLTLNMVVDLAVGTL